MKNISRLLSLVLRHQPQVLGIELDEHGWTNVKELILAIKENNGTIVTEEDILNIVENKDDSNSKRRFALSEDKKNIRANQGHSVNVDVQLKEYPPPEFLFHGTVDKFKNSIKTEGLKKMSRNHVHLSSDLGTATTVGRRRGKAIILRVRSGDMHLDGYKFYLSENKVWLTDHVPVEYIEF